MWSFYAGPDPWFSGGGWRWTATIASYSLGFADGWTLFLPVTIKAAEPSAERDDNGMMMMRC
jgi:hypothetical protein